MFHRMWLPTFCYANVGKVDSSQAKRECSGPWQVSLPPLPARLAEAQSFSGPSLAPAPGWEPVVESYQEEDVDEETVISEEYNLSCG